MPSPRRHIIRTASLEVNAGAVDAFRFQQEAVSWAQDQLMRELDGIFASLPDDGTHVILDRLDIRLEASGPARWKEEILPRLKTELAAVLARAMSEGGRGEAEEKLNPGMSFFRNLAYYLEHGVLPWNLMAAGRADLNGRMEEWLASEESRESVSDLAMIWKRPSVRTRFLQTFPPDLISRLLVRLFRMPESLLTAWSRDASRITGLDTALPLARPPRAFEAPSGPPALPAPLLQEALSALSHDPKLFEHGLEEEIVHAYLGRVLLEVSLDKQSWQAVPFASAAFRNSLDRLVRPSRQADRPPIPAVTPTGAEAWSPAPEGRTAAPDPEPASRPQRSQRDPAAEGLFIPNAGLILLAPFFGMFFERLNLIASVDEKASMDKASEERPARHLRDPGAAIAILHFLATAQEGPAEFEVPLAKVLCGIPLEKTISLPMSLAPHIHSEAVQLLAGAIGHWSVLKDTSPDGLRESFLQRPGKLTRRPKGEWLLQVEQKSFDMLLQQLPWNFRLIRLPWMEHVLHTEWVE